MTSLHVRQALGGDACSLSWVVEHFTPALRMQARYRLWGEVRRVCEPDDLVQEVWVTALPRLPNLRRPDGRWTPVLVKFLGTILLHRANKIVRCHIRGEKYRREFPAPLASGSTGPLERIPAEVTDVVSRLGQHESQKRLSQCIDELSPQDREVVVLRGIEQIPNQQVAVLLGVKPGTVAMRYHRALGRLREAMPGSVFAELEENPPDR